MKDTKKMQGFITRCVYIAIWVGIIYVLLQYGMPLFMPFLIAFLIATLLNPLITKMAEKTPLGYRASAVLILIVVYLIIAGLLAILGSRLVLLAIQGFEEIPQMYNTYIEPAIHDVIDWSDDFILGLDPSIRGVLDSMNENMATMIEDAIAWISSSAIEVLSGFAVSVPWVVAGVVICIISSFFFVSDYHVITRFLSLQIPKNVKRILLIIKDFTINVLLKFARAYCILLSITFVEVSVGLLILGVPNVFLIAFITAIVDIIPVFGTGTIMIPWALYSLFSGNYFLGIGLLILYGVITVIRQFLEPRVVGHQISLYPLLTLISMFIGARLFGFWGLFGLPVAITIVLHLNRIGEISILVREDDKNDEESLNISASNEAEKLPHDKK